MKLVQVLVRGGKRLYEDPEPETWISVNPAQVSSVGPVTHGLSKHKSYVRFVGGGTLETLHTYEDLHKLINAALRG